MNVLNTDLIFSLAPALRGLMQRGGSMGTLRFCAGATDGDLFLEKTLSEELYAEAAEKLDGYFRTEGRFPSSVVLRGQGAFFFTPPTEEPARLRGKIALVTGAAQGIGKDVADLLVSHGARVVYADRNGEGAQAAAEEACRLYGVDTALALTADVGDEASVREMVRNTVLAYGGLDVFVSNAGIVRSGGLDDMTLADFELCMKVNYTGYFLGVKYAQQVMRLQHRFCSEALFDIVQINSKSGLEGSNRNFAYAGSKAGGIGLTKSFALELCPYNIKVNAVCPGNYLDGPLWSDPDNGLFLQFLRAGKVPGAKTVADVRRYYEAKVPMKRGCSSLDVARAVLYCVEQAYETGQAIPVTGGQIMLS